MSWFAERFDERPARFRHDCEVCTRPMWFPRCKLGKYRTCGAECAASARQAVRDARTRPCETCGLLFTPRTNQPGRYCSQACNTAGQTAVNSAQAQEKAVAVKRAMFASGELQGLRGQANPRWNGGKDAAKARARKQVAQYKRDNPDRVRAWAHNRRQRVGNVTVAVIRELRTLQRGHCAACRCVPAKGLQLDHIVPVARGGTNARANLQLLCPGRNARKGAKDPLRFMQERGFLL